jgi:hypothetical protein
VIQDFVLDGDVIVAEDGTSNGGACGLNLPPSPSSSTGSTRHSRHCALYSLRIRGFGACLQRAEVAGAQLVVDHRVRETESAGRLGDRVGQPLARVLRRVGRPFPPVA